MTDGGVGGRFVVEREAGSGGMGTVYRARDLVAGAPVALKILRAGDVIDAQRFAREAAMLSELGHPGIVRYVHHGLTADGAFIAMEWLEGQTLAERLALAPLGVGESVRVALRAAEALAAVHARGVV